MDEIRNTALKTRSAININSFCFIVQLVHIDAEKGRGVIATKVFQRGDFVVEYAGELIEDMEEARRREEHYREEDGSYTYYFKHESKHYWSVGITSAPFVLITLSFSVTYSGL